jgi:D-3-phosphoglycerate dehydrogenase
MDIVIAEEMQGPTLERLAQQYRITRDAGLWREPARLIASLGEARVLIVRNQTQVTAEVLTGASKLLAIGRVGVGLDNIDMALATRLGVVVIAPLGANATSVAELAFGLMLGLARKIPPASASTKAGNWDRKSFMGMELDGKTLGLCGFGRIGQLVAVRARAFGMRVVVFDPYVKPDAPVLRESNARLCAELKEALQQADFVSVHLPLTPQTRQMFNQQAFAAMKPGACFINTSRGGVVDEADLLASLQNGHLGGAGLDVREVEPPQIKTGIESMSNVLLTPHIGAFTKEAQFRTIEAVAGDVERLLAGQPVLNGVNFDRPKRSTALA